MPRDLAGHEEAGVALGSTAAQQAVHGTEAWERQSLAPVVPCAAPAGCCSHGREFISAALLSQQPPRFTPPELTLLPAQSWDLPALPLLPGPPSCLDYPSSLHHLSCLSPLPPPQPCLTSNKVLQQMLWAQHICGGTLGWFPKISDRIGSHGEMLDPAGSRPQGDGAQVIR
jgi:hypothetical protein